MKIIVATFTIFLMLSSQVFIFSSTAFAQNPAQSPAVVRSISVIGKAETKVVPDTFSINFGFSQRDSDLSKIKQQVDSQVEQAVEYLIAAGVPKNQISSMHINLYPWQEWEDKKQVQKGYVYSRDVNFEYANIEAFDSIVQGLAKFDPATLGSFQLSYSKAQESEQKLMQQALLNAKQKAKDMANTLGMELGHTIEIRQIGANTYLPEMKNNRVMQADSMSQRSGSQPGEQTINVEVGVMFELSPKWNFN